VSRESAWRFGAVALLLFVAGRCLVPMDETDLFFNLRLGEIVLQTGHVPRQNLLSFTHPQAADVNLAWLFQALLALVHRAGGIPATVVMKTAFVVAAWALLYGVARRRGAHPAVAALGLALAAWAAEPRFVERPHLVTFLGLAFLLLALERAEADRPRMLHALVPLGILWANGNSCFFLAPALLLLYAAGARLDGLRREAGRAALVAAALVPLAFATPSGAGWLRYVANHFRMPWVRPLQEYRVAEWLLDGPFFFLLAGMAIVAVAGWVLRRGGRAAGVPWRQLLPVLAFAVLGARRIRFVAEFAMLAGPALAAGATAVLGSLPRRSPRPGPDLGPELGPELGAELGPELAAAPLGAEVRRGPIAAASLALLLLAVAPRISAGRPFIDLCLERDLVPFAAIAFVEEHGLAERLYNDLEVGSYLTWRWWPRRRVFQDPRINGYPDSFHAVLRRPDLDRAAWQAFLEGHGVTAALITYPELNPRAALFDPGRWALVYRASDALVFARRRPEWRALIAARELPVTFRHTRESGTASEPIDVRPPETPLSGCQWQRRLGDHLVEVGDDQGASRAYERALGERGCQDLGAQIELHRTLGSLALRLDNPTAALAHLRGLDDAESRTNRAFALLGLKRPPEALDAFESVLALTPAQAEALFGRALALEALGRRREAEAALRAFLARHPRHLAAPAAAERLARLAWGPVRSPPRAPEAR
jgi:hypothetical protein